MHRKITGIIIAMSFLLTACSNMHVVNDENSEQINLLIIKITAREISKEICKHKDCNEDIVAVTDMINLYIQYAKDGNFQAIDLGKAYVVSLCDDEDLRSDLTDLFDLVIASDSPDEELGLTNEDKSVLLTRMEYALIGFQQGIKKKE